MVQLPSRHKLPALDEEADPLPPGASLWEMALQGRGGSSLGDVASSSESGGPRRRRRLWIAGVATVLVLVLAGTIALLGLGTATDASLGTSDQSGGPSSGAPVSSNGTTSRQGSPCLAQPLVANPAVGATEEIVVGNVPYGAAVTVVVAYPGGSARYSAAPTSNGYANVPITVASAPSSQPVEVLVTTGHTSCQTSFTPAASTSG